MTQSRPPVQHPHLAAPVVRQVVTRVAASRPRGAELPGPPPPREDVLPVRSSVTTLRDGAGLTVVLTGDVDVVLGAELARALRGLEDRLEHLIAGGDRGRVHLDVRAVRALDAHALRFVEAVRTACAHRGVPCTTSGARPAVRRVLDLVRPVVDGHLAAS